MLRNLVKKGAALFLPIVMSTSLMMTNIPVFAATEDVQTSKNFDLVEITDFHGQLLDSTGKLYVGAALSKAVKDIRSNNPDKTLVLGGGDLYQGTPISNVLHGVPVQNVFSDMGMELTALGNHEFDWNLNTIINETMKDASYKIICANLYNKGTDKRVFDGYKVVTKDGVRIAVIGAITNETPTIVMPAYAADYEFRDAASEISSTASKIRLNNEADVVLALIHEGGSGLNQVVSKLHGVDAIFGGHSHSTLDTVLKDADGKNIPALNANSSGKGYIDLKMTIGADNKISFSSSGNYKSLSVTSTTPIDLDAKKIIDAANIAIGPVFNEVIGKTTEALTSNQSGQPYGESQLGNWISGVIRNYANADVALANNGGIRLSPIQAGDITVGTIFTLMPFDNTICTVNMTGAQLKVLLEQAVQDDGKGIQVSGMKFTYDSTKLSYQAAVVDSSGNIVTPEVMGQRIIKMVRESDNTEILNTDVVKVAAPDFVATGGDKFTEFTDPQIKATLIDSHYMVRDALIADVRAKGTIPNVMNGRIVNKPSSGTATEMTIKQARTAGTGSVTITGIVTTVCDKNIFIQDDTAGINFYNSAGAKVKKGDKIKLTGPLSQYNNLLEITPKTAGDVQVISSGNTVALKEVTVNQINESLESQVIKLKGVTINNIDTSSSSIIQDATGKIAIFKIPALTGIAAGDKVDVIAAVSQFGTEYELRVGEAVDVVKAESIPVPTSATISILATSDLHGNIYNYDYATGTVPSKGQGLAKVSAFVKSIRSSNPNVILIDNGDTIQGTPLSYYYDMIDKTSEYPMIKVMGAMGYDAWTLGNHEYNYGLDTLNRIIADAKKENIAVLSSNTYNNDGANFVKPYFIKSFDINGKNIKVGVLGLTTKTIPSWEDAAHYSGLQFNDLVDDAKKWVPVLKNNEKCDIVVVSAHSGEESASDVIPENQVKALATQVSGIDAIVAGHVHSVLNDLTLKNPEGKTVPVLEPGKWGNYVSEIDINVNESGIIAGLSTKNVTMDSNYPEDTAITTLAQPYQNHTLQYIETVLGVSDDEFKGAGQYVVPTAIMDLVNKVQMDAAGTQLSIAAPLSSTAYIPKGNVTIKDIMSVYVYENFLYGVKMTGKQLKNWMEYSVRYYKQINDPSFVIDGSTNYSTLKDNVLNIPDYNLDQLYGATYDIDLTQPACTVDPVSGVVISGNRIKNLKVNGINVKDTDVFTVAINNYRYNGGGGFMKAVGLSNTDQGIVTYDSAKKLGDDGQVRSLMMSYIKAKGNIAPTCSNSWKLYTVPVTEQNEMLNVSVSSVSTNPGKSAIVKIIMSNMKDIAGMKMKLRFDSDKLTVKSVILADAFSANAINTNTPGEIYFNAVNSDGITSTKMDIATITFAVNQSISIEDIPVSFVTCEACDAAFGNIPVTTSNGLILVEPTVLPIATNVSFSGEAVVGKLLAATYDYSDSKNRPESGTTFRWMTAEHGTGNYAYINGAESKTLLVTQDLLGKDIRVEVTVRNNEDTGLQVSGDNGRNMVIRIGDVNKNGTVDFIDALMALKSITQKVTLDNQAAVTADVDNNNVIDVNDVTAILRSDVGLVLLY
ncbi:MAG: 5'-nucleotidase C-terminal domain-containing protein [Bacillota bacterium]|nr:5'-nucleotidase C-terminal domain-containing protein [Bacillota bacterium]